MDDSYISHTYKVFNRVLPFTAFHPFSWRRAGCGVRSEPSREPSREPAGCEIAILAVSTTKDGKSWRPRR